VIDDVGGANVIGHDVAKDLSCLAEVGRRHAKESLARFGVGANGGEGLA